MVMSRLNIFLASKLYTESINDFTKIVQDDKQFILMTLAFIIFVLCFVEVEMLLIFKSIDYKF